MTRPTRTLRTAVVRGCAAIRRLMARVTRAWRRHRERLRTDPTYAAAAADVAAEVAADLAADLATQSSLRDLAAVIASALTALRSRLRRDTPAPC